MGVTGSYAPKIDRAGALTVFLVVCTLNVKTKPMATTTTTTATKTCRFSQLFGEGSRTARVLPPPRPLGQNSTSVCQLFPSYALSTRRGLQQHHRLCPLCQQAQNAMLRQAASTPVCAPTSGVRGRSPSWRKVP